MPPEFVERGPKFRAGTGGNAVVVPRERLAAFSFAAVGVARKRLEERGLEGGPHADIGKLEFKIGDVGA